jgi:hypothetical protein
LSTSAALPNDAKSTSTLPEQPGVLVVRKHHFLVRWSHWLNVPILLGLVLSGISIYWASPIYGAPLRLLVPVKLGLKNVKAITRITYVAEEPRDYWAERGYSRYDGI